jgi:hypothetical protein
MRGEILAAEGKLKQAVEVLETAARRNKARHRRNTLARGSVHDRGAGTRTVAVPGNRRRTLMIWGFSDEDWPAHFWQRNIKNR